MKTLRILAIVFGVTAVTGEAYRSWGVGRPIAFWLDDVIAGSLLVSSAIAVGVETTRRRAFFSGAWGVAAGMCYLSFFEKVFAPETINTGNASLGSLTALAGVGLAATTAGLIASIVLPTKPTTRP